MFFTARFAQDAELAKGNDFSIAVERTAMENQSAALEFGCERVICCFDISSSSVNKSVAR